MRLMTLVLTVLACAVVGAAGAQSSDEAHDRAASRRVVVTRGEAIVRKAPDRAYLMLGTEVTARAPGEAQRRNAELMSAVQQRLKTLVPQEAIRTLSYTLQEEFDHVDNRRVPRGYRASNTIEVRVDELPRLGEIIDAAVGAGATTVHNIRFDLKDRDSAEREALRLAVADARGRAEAAAGGAGLQLASIVRIEEQGRAIPLAAMGRMEMDMAARAETPITPGQIEIHSSVSLTAEIR
jgi:uncharacterized protein YggE